MFFIEIKLLILIKLYIISIKIKLLLSLTPTSGKTYDTESYLPNIEYCNNNLIPHGIKVRVVYDDSQLSFEDKYFDTIINRHESKKQVYSLKSRPILSV